MFKHYLNSMVLLSLATINFAQSDFDCSTLDPIVTSLEINLCENSEDEVTLEAQTNTGNRIYWYDSENSDEPIGRGFTLELGKILSDISYWVTEGHLDYGVKIEGQALQYDDKGVNRGQGIAGVGLLFEAFQAFIINTVDVYSTHDGGEVTIQLMDSQGDLIVEKKEMIPRGGGNDNPILHTVNLNFEVPGAGGYSLVLKDSGVNLMRTRTSPDKFPYPLGDVGNIIDGIRDNKPTERGQYEYFYNWTVQAVDLVCESDPKEISIFVNDDYPDNLNIDSVYILCGNENFVLGDVVIDGTNNLLWFDDKGVNLADTTIIEEGTTYNVADESPGGCRGGLATISFVIQDISEQPIADTEQSFEEGSGVTLASLEVEGENLQWYADADKEEELSEETELEDATTYYVTQTLEDYCESMPLGITVLSSLGVADVIFENLQYNNPVTDILYVSNNEAFESVILYDITGKELSVDVSLRSPNNINLDLSRLNSGTYLLAFKVKEVYEAIHIIKK